MKLSQLKQIIHEEVQSRLKGKSILKENTGVEIQKPKNLELIGYPSPDAYGTQNKQIKVKLNAGDTVKLQPLSGNLSSIKVLAVITLTPLADKPLGANTAAKMADIIAAKIFEGSGGYRTDADGMPYFGAGIDLEGIVNGAKRQGVTFTVKYIISASPSVLFTTEQGTAVNSNLHS
jgi:hypothetical protein